MPLNARNHLKGEVTEVVLGVVTALVVTAVIKATEVMIQKD